MLPERLRSFHPAAEGWVAVFVDLEAAPSSPEPWYVAAVVGWAHVEEMDAHHHPFDVIHPVIGGDAIDWNGTTEHVGVYHRSDLVERHVRERLLALCTKLRANYHQQRIGLPR